MKIMGVVLVMLLVGGIVSANTCSSYFTGVVDKRNQINSMISSLELSTSRLRSSIGYLVDDIDSLDSNENLTSLSDSFHDLANRKGDVANDISDLSGKIDSYDTKISESRSGLPSTCYSVFTSYDNDMADVMDYFRNVNKKWSVFKTRYDAVMVMDNNLAIYTRSHARPIINDADDAVQELEDVIGEIPTTINESSNVALMNQSDCFNMIKKNVDIGINDCNKKCNERIAGLNTTAQACDPPADYYSTKTQLSTCQNDYSSLSQTCRTSCPECKVCTECQNQNQNIDAVNAKVSELTVSNTALSVKLANITAQYDTLKKSSVACAVCENCTMWKVAAVGLIILLVAAWIIRM